MSKERVSHATAFIVRPALVAFSPLNEVRNGNAQVIYVYHDQSLNQIAIESAAPYGANSFDFQAAFPNRMKRIDFKPKGWQSAFSEEYRP